MMNRPNRPNGKRGRPRSCLGAFVTRELTKRSHGNLGRLRAREGSLVTHSVTKRSHGNLGGLALTAPADSDPSGKGTPPSR
jgi:hypothetical protein